MCLCQAGRTRDMDKHLKQIKKILDNLGIEFFLMLGTLLGAIREKDFIKGDIDIDLGIFGEERRDDIRDVLKKLGIPQNTDNMRVISIKGDVMIDIYFFVKRGNEMMSFAKSDSICPHYCFPERYAKLKKIRFRGDDFLVPGHTKEFLTYIYGDWRTPSNEQARNFIGIQTRRHSNWLKYRTRLIKLLGTGIQKNINIVDLIIFIRIKIREVG